MKGIELDPLKNPLKNPPLDNLTLFTPRHYFSCICTKKTKSEQCDFPTNFQVFEENFHLFPGNHFPGNLLWCFISLKTFPGKLLSHKAFIAIILNSKFFNANSLEKNWHGWGMNSQAFDLMSVALSKQLRRWNENLQFLVRFCSNIDSKSLN